VLVTGVGRFLAARLAGALAADPSVDRIIGVDTAPPGRAERALLGRTEFVRATSATR
jgi:UDP-glucose 4-epimerase